MRRIEVSRLAGRLLLVVGMVLVPGGSHGIAQEADGWTPELALQVKRVREVRVSPDGSSVAFVVARARMEDEESEWRSHIHLSDSQGRDSRQLTRGPESATSPAWAPDGKWIAFLSRRGGTRGVWRIPVDGGEAQPITHEEGNVETFAWAPDGTHIAFTMRPANTAEEKRDKKEKRDARVVDGDLKPSDLYVVAVGEEPSSGRRLTRGTFHVGGVFASGMDWAPDGKSIVFTHAPSSRVDQWIYSDISVVDLSDSRVRAVASTAASESSPFFSPDGAWIAYLASDDPPSWAFTRHLHVVPSSGGTPRRLAATREENSRLLGWSSDARRLFVSVPYGTSSRIAAVGVDGSEPAFLTPASTMVVGAQLNSSATHLGFVSESPNTPPEAFLSTVDSFEPRPVSTVQTLPDLPIGTTEVIRWKSGDGMEIEGLLTYPVRYREGERVPLLVLVHGGPTGVFTQSFIASRGVYPIAAFAAQGYAVLRCNVRGSSGYGRAFRYANYKDWGGGDYQDILSGVDHVIDLGVADPDRLGVMGWSYGGYMTSWIITQTHRFGAASVGAGVTNLMSFTGTADIPGFIPDYMGGEYWDEFHTWSSHSAMFQVKGVATPTLIQHGEEDLRVPISQGYELYNALKRQTVPTKMIVYPRQGHGIREPKLRLQAMQANLEWFGKWLLKR